MSSGMRKIKYEAPERIVLTEDRGRVDKLRLKCAEYVGRAPFIAGDPLETYKRCLLQALVTDGHVDVKRAVVGCHRLGLHSSTAEFTLACTAAVGVIDGYNRGDFSRLVFGTGLAA
jgi:hypothetical protein